MILKRVILAILFVLLVATGYFGYPRVAYDLDILEGSGNIYYEPGAEDLAQLAAANLPISLDKVRQSQYLPFKNPEKIKVYVFNDIDRYARFSQASNLTRGSSTTDEIYISAKLRDKIDTLPGILTHELSHVHIRQYTGTWRYIRDVPGWFLEGIAVLVSSGAGAETVSEQQAVEYLKENGMFELQAKGGSYRHKYAHDYGLKPHMYYRIASLYVNYLRQTDPAAFEAAYKEMLLGSSFRDAWEKHYGKSNAELWQDFLASL
jgi:hypothetical protein